MVANDRSLAWMRTLGVGRKRICFGTKIQPAVSVICAGENAEANTGQSKEVSQTWLDRVAGRLHSGSAVITICFTEARGEARNDARNNTQEGPRACYQ